MANNGMVFSMRKKQITIKVSNEVEFKKFILSLKRKMPKIKELYKDITPRILIIGREFKEKEMSSIQKMVDKFFDVNVDFDCSKMLGLSYIRKPFKQEIPTSETKYVKTSLRSGQRVEFEGSIVVLRRCKLWC